ncbi:hypothetical protein BEI_2813 [Halomonas beimenensis]|uniref:Uncharacterized protein n=1 Tax=Halomonas beimenensis TaxID=475662 RepID=A0A291PA77_9GAMM|nr:hypothetical protein BEI_2813 [Halomonas beimenensis]
MYQFCLIIAAREPPPSPEQRDSAMPIRAFLAWLRLAATG